jgi:hypothetical protein
MTTGRRGAHVGPEMLLKPIPLSSLAIIPTATDPGSSAPPRVVRQNTTCMERCIFPQDPN